MPTAEPTLQTLYDALIFDITKAFALPQTNSAQQIVRWLFGRAARRVAELGLGLDREVQKGGLRGGSRWLLPRFAKNHSARASAFHRRRRLLS